MKLEGTGLALLWVCAGLVGCEDGGSRSHLLPWDSHDTRVIDGDRQVSEIPSPIGDRCIDVETGVCIKPQEQCGANAADVVLAADGKLLEIICYPPAATLSVEELETKGGAIAQNQNNSVLALDNANDGVDVRGDIAVDANNVVIYGEDPATSVVGGDVNVDGNNIIVRGVSIQGDVTIDANNATFFHCVVEGNVTVTGNNAVFVGCDVFGTIKITGHNAHVAGNHVVGGVVDDGKNTRCEDNRAAQDRNADRVLVESELGAALSC
jgi:hypothetical protein